MKAQEVRIGTYIQFDTHLFIVKDVTIKQLVEGFVQYQPIPLTEEWLLKFGFVQFPASNLWDKEDFWAIYKKANKEEWRCDHLEMQFKYVHQLQNLYFALTGEELTIE